ncbi:MAG: hypothetical protein IJR46_06835, partial [Neisseriaceae bacterium]|nr:hypothetical protein [Neisseriaceae bacterium]
IAGPAFGVSASTYAQGSASSKDSTDGFYAQTCGTVKLGGSFGACAGLSENGSAYGSGSSNVGIGIGLETGAYGEIGYSKTFKKAF